MTVLKPAIATIILFNLLFIGPPTFIGPAIAMDLGWSLKQTIGIYFSITVILLVIVAIATRYVLIGKKGA